jgi:hypothetical protein
MLNELFIKIKTDFKDAQKGFQEFGKETEKFGKGVKDIGGSITKSLTLPIIAVGGALFATAKNAGEMADRIFDLTAITGMSAKSIQEWQYVSKIAGTETEAVTKAAVQLNRAMYGLDNGTGKASAAFEQIGLEFESFEKLNADDRINAVVKAMSKIKDPTERARIGTELFSRSWAEIAPIIDMGIAAIEDAKKEANDFGVVLDEDALQAADDFRVMIERLTTKFQAFGLKVAQNVLPVIQKLVPIFEEHLLPIFDKLLEKIGEAADWFESLDKEGQKNVITWGLIFLAIGPVVTILGGLIGIISTGIAIFIGLSAAMSGTVLATNASTVSLVAYRIAQGLGAVATGIATAATWAFNAAMAVLTSPIFLVVAAIAGLVAIGVLLVKNWDFIWAKAQELGKGIMDAFAPVGKFLGDMFGLAFNLIKGYINFWISAVNFIISGLNKIQVTIPKWVPLIGGLQFGVNIPKIPMLAEGGIVDSPTLALIGEAGPEAVVPLNKQNNPMMNDQPLNITLQINSTTLGKVTIDSINKLTRQEGKLLLNI